jgi:hypothetical protein
MNTVASIFHSIAKTSPTLIQTPENLAIIMPPIAQYNPYLLTTTASSALMTTNG